MPDPKPWKHISSKVLLDNALLRITEDTLMLPDGRQSKYVRQAPTDVDAVAIVAVNNKGQILLQREYSYPPNKVMWQLPGGAMELGESIVAAAKRELSEESGYDGHTIKSLGSFYVQNRFTDKQQHVLLFTDLFLHKLTHDHDEFIENHWLSKSEVMELLKTGELDNINLLAGLSFWLHSEPKEIL
jgi:ADP-ribose pyrophosphatase